MSVLGTTNLDSLEKIASIKNNRNSARAPAHEPLSIINKKSTPFGMLTLFFNQEARD